MQTLLLTALCAGEENAGPSYKSSGYVYWENFRLWKADYKGNNHEGDWFNSILAGLVLENAMSERLKTRVALEAKFYRPFPEEQNKEESRFTKFTTYVHEAKAKYIFGNIEQPPFEMEVGLFLYDYNKNQRNLGEYLFRSQIYPCNLFTDFAYPLDKLLGVRLGNAPFEGFHHDLLLTSEYKYYPKSDFSISYLFDYRMAEILEFGGGISLHHYLPVRPSLKTPKTEQNLYLEGKPQVFEHATYDIQGIPTDTVMDTLNTPIEGFPATLRAVDSISYMHAGTFSRRIYEEIQFDSTYFTYKGIKLMGRLTFDPKPLFGSPPIMGPEDLKLYAEAAVLGVKDYPFLYDNIKERIPVMFGFNIPCFNILDVFAVELEYFGYKLPNNWQRSLMDGVPHPGSMSFVFSEWNKDDYEEDDWKWSIYATKEVSRGLAITAQVACDHLRLIDQFDNTFETVMKDTGPLFTDHWWGIIRVTASY